MDEHEQLERATEPAADIEEPGLADTSPLRETWLWFGRLLQADVPEWDETDFVGRIQARLEQRRRLRAARLVSAAAILICVATTLWFLKPFRGFGPNVVQGPAPLEWVESLDSTDEVFGWQDDLDEEMVFAQLDFQEVERSWKHRPDSVDVVRHSLNELEAELKSSPF